jgi:hypothetical protein
MKKLSIDNLIEFRRRKSDGSRFTFLNNTQKEKEKKLVKQVGIIGFAV